MRIEFDDINPHRGQKRERYDKYKSAQTVGEARSLGALPSDLDTDIFELQVAELIIEENG